MNCRDTEKLLAVGRHLTRDAEEHLKECPVCRSLMDAFEPLVQPLDSIPDLPSKLLDPMSSVKPLPSDRVLISLVLAIFLGFSLVLGLALGSKGFSHLNPAERMIYYAVVGLCGLLFSTASVQSAIPGAKVRVARGVAIAGALGAVALTVALLFQNFDLNNFVAPGIHCLLLGCTCAALFGGVAAIFLRRAYVTDIRATALLIGCFAGFSGVAVLSLHCPLHNAAHIIVWHLGAVAVSGFGGLMIGALNRSTTVAN